VGYPGGKRLVLDEDLALQDWDEVVALREATGKDIEGRDSVFRLGPVNHLDRELCRRAFGLVPEEVARALNGRVEAASVLLDGVFIVASSRLISRDELEVLNRNLREALAVSR
jgi:hypothetical protein